MNNIIKWVMITTAVVAAASAITYFTVIKTGSENVPRAEEIDPDDITVAAVGDSTTYGLMIDNRAENAYPHKLNERLGEDYWVGNYGASNYAAMKSADYPYSETSEYRNSLELEADIAVIMLGTNDSKEINWQGSAQFKKEYSELIETYTNNNPDIKIYLATPPKAFNDVEQPDYINNDNINEITEVIKEISVEKDISLIDINQLTQDKRGWFQMDGIHPNAEGADHIAEEIQKHISE